MSITVEILPEAQRMIDEADERWSTEHGFDAINPLLQIPDAVTVTHTPMFLLGGQNHRIVVLSAADREQVASDAQQRAKVQLPSAG